MTIKAHFHDSVCCWVLWHILPWLKKPSLVPLIWTRIVIKACNSFSRLFGLFFVASKRLIFFFTICDRISSCAGIVLWSSLSRLHGLRALISNGSSTFRCLNHLLLYNGSQIELWCGLSLVVSEMALRFWFSSTTNVFKRNLYD